MICKNKDGKSMAISVYEMILQSTLNEVRRVEEFVKKMAEEHFFSETFIYDLMLVVTEATNNAVIHGNKLDESKTAYLKCQIDKQDGRDRLFVEVHDEGAGFNPEELPNPLAEENLMKPSGRGVFLMKQFADIQYDFSKKGTVVRISIDVY
ncbi:MAG: ATP-binding protein [Chlorobiales bacterium]|jgi:serine/threonine-protein kinase RsbW|nr:ATP-binding protein [Chlorobiales bacterium]